MGRLQMKKADYQNELQTYMTALYEDDELASYEEVLKNGTIKMLKEAIIKIKKEYRIVGLKSKEAKNENNN
jgi:hypothetical protein